MERFGLYMGALYVIFASLLFGITPSGNNYVLLSGMGADCTFFYQALTMTIGCGLVLAVRRIVPRVPPKEVLLLLFIGAVGMGGTDYLLNVAYLYLPVSTVVMLHFLYPAIVLLVSAVLFHQKVTKVTGTAVFLSLLGLILVTDFSGEVRLIGVCFALGSAFVYAFYSLSNEHGSINRHPLLVKLFYFSLGAVLTFGLKAGLQGNLQLPANGKVAFAMFGIVGLGSLVGFYLITAGIKKIGAGKASFLNMLEPITGIIGGVLFFHEVIVLRAFIGCVCVLLAVLLIALEDASKGKTNE